MDLYDNFFESFTYSVAASRILLSEAHSRGSFIEGLMLYASLIDALLRNLVALETGARTGHTRSLDSRYFVHDGSKWLNERRVYAEARAAGVIDEATFMELEDLYRFRNIVVHRFIVSPVAYSDIPPKLDRYNALLESLFEQLREIEQPDDEQLSPERIGSIRTEISRKLHRPD